MRFWTVLLFASLLFHAEKGNAQGTANGIIYWPHRDFKVPFNIPTGAESQLTKIELYASTTEGQVWDLVATAYPNQRQFGFSAKQEGLHWFAVKTFQTNGTASPADRTQLKPMIQVVIDWTAPVVQLQALAPRNSEVGVSWDIRDSNFSATVPDSLRLEYRPANSAGGWTPLIIPPGLDRLYWSPNFTGALEVKLTAKDRAGNPSTVTTTVQAPSLFSMSPSPPGNPGNSGSTSGSTGITARPEMPGAPPLSDRTFVNSSKIVLNYNLKEVGRSGVKKLQLWYTSDLGRTWETLPEVPYESGNNRLSFNVPKEGLYGISIVAKSGADLGSNPPQPGDKPQKWIDVDLSPPTVRLERVNVHTGPEKGKVTITWTAKDNKQLQANPVRLYYSPKSGDPGERKWTPITQEKLSNSGSYTWTLPRDESIPYEFYVKVEALDLAGNMGEDDRKEVVNVDLSRPMADITSVEPVKDNP